MEIGIRKEWVGGTGFVKQGQSDSERDIARRRRRGEKVFSVRKLNDNE